jgi:ferredoxin-NADP reductase
LDKYPVRAGQFLIVRFLAKGFRWEAHPFSMSCRPDGKQIRLTIKQLGDFTRKIPELKPGTPVLIDGPNGIFTSDVARSGKVLMIAGGIGITPIRSVAEEMVAAGRDIVLIYGNRNSKSVVFDKELNELAGSSQGRLKVIHVMSDDQAWQGEKGRIDRERIARLVPDVLERDVFLCGPPVMMGSIRAALAGMGVVSSRIHYERFAL